MRSVDRKVKLLHMLLFMSPSNSVNGLSNTTSSTEQNDQVEPLYPSGISPPEHVALQPVPFCRPHVVTYRMSVFRSVRATGL